MCGICGVVSSTTVSDPSWLTAAKATMSHRGPDDEGEWWSRDHSVGMAHRRLSILDLSHAGHQPMTNMDGSLCLVFNGEIYNFDGLRRQMQKEGYLFKSRSDSEVLLAAAEKWGPECLRHLDGMFAFAVYNSHKRTLLMARDRAGEKPLYYSLSRGILKFSSGLKGLLQCPDQSREIDSEALECYLTFGYVPGEKCLIRNVNKLPPAHALLFEQDTGEMKIWKYWDPPACGFGNEGQEDLVNELEQVLTNAVRRQLVSDVPLGILLSGGVDSSLITALAARVIPKLKTFTVVFPGTRSQDESQHARAVAQFFATDHLEIKGEEIRPEIMRSLVTQADEPVADSSLIPTFVIAREVRKICKVVLGGDGGDELFGGYKHYNALLGIESATRWIPRGLRSGVAGAGLRLFPRGSLPWRLSQKVEGMAHSGLAITAPLLGLHVTRPSNATASTGSPAAGDLWARRVPKDADLLQRATRADFSNYLAERVLVKLDRMSMFHSLETRAPFLDRKVIEFAFSRVPSRLKATWTRRKILPKLLAAKLMPNGFDLRRKAGFSIPLRAWLSHPLWARFARDILLSKHSLLEGSTANKLLNEARMTHIHAETIFSLVLLELWRVDYGTVSNFQIGF